VKALGLTRVIIAHDLSVIRQWATEERGLRPAGFQGVAPIARPGHRARYATMEEMAPLRGEGHVL
jgi:hypothetical protein